MLVVDDSLLLLVLAGVGGTQITEAVLASEVFTTGSWYWRLARAIRDPRSTGALTRAFAASRLRSKMPSGPHWVSCPETSG